MSTTTTEKKLTGQATDAQIKEWKDQHKKIFFIKDAEETHIAYFRKATRMDVATALKEDTDENLLASTEKMADLLWIGGSKEILTNDDMWLDARKHINKQFSGSGGTISGNL